MNGLGPKHHVSLGPVSAVGKRPCRRPPRYRPLKLALLPAARSKLKKSQNRPIVLVHHDGYDLPRKRTCRQRKPQTILDRYEQELLPPLESELDSTATKVLEVLLDIEMRVAVSNRQLKDREIGRTRKTQKGTHGDDSDDEMWCLAEHQKVTIPRCRWGKMTLTPGEMGAMYRLRPSLTDVYAIWELALFYAVDTKVPMDLVTQEPLEHLALVPLSPTSPYARSAMSLQIPDSSCPARDMYRMVRTLGEKRQPQSTSSYNCWRQYHTHLYGGDAPAFPAWYFPCDHPGKCTLQSCTCIRAFNFCTPLCCNGLASKNAFKGCHCTSGCKLNWACGCRRSNRECDPATCRCEGCTNNDLQQGPGPRLRVAPSTVPDCGQGAFATCDLTQDQFVGEYIGELISEAECARRFPIQRAILGHNYMAQVTSDVVIDASRFGNDLRYINHDHDAPNCVVRLIFVRSRWRLALYTLRPVSTGEELFFDYGPSFFPRALTVTTVPSIKDVSQKRPTTKHPIKADHMDFQAGSSQEALNLECDSESSDSETEGSSLSPTDEDTVATMVAVFASPGEYWLGRALIRRKGSVLLQWMDDRGGGIYTFLPTQDWVTESTLLLDGVPMYEKDGGWAVEANAHEWLKKACETLRIDQRGRVLAVPPETGSTVLTSDVFDPNSLANPSDRNCSIRSSSSNGSRSISSNCSSSSSN